MFEEEMAVNRYNCWLSFIHIGVMYCICNADIVNDVASYGALGHRGTFPLDFQQPNFSVHFRAARSLTATLCSCLCKHIYSPYYFVSFCIPQIIFM